ncbi:uncharacterized protein LOC110020792 [Phalaenopsis equestris]|uniref:uncharacterized protein LOC110020792 n=1 Tax=Phalaenopsis equestris TaxID=78828 RepID=UPI0009E4CA52|nr:uncharacterized protein LOC110020792 [Phalaenopsis equestris]
MAASIPWHRPLFLPTKPDPPNYRFTTATISRTSTIRAFHRSDFDGFARRVTSGEALRDAWRSANEGIEQLAFEARRTVERIDRRYAVSRRIGSAARAAASRAQEIDYEIGISRRWRYFSMDFSRNWPRYRRELNGFLQTPIGRGSMMAFFFWFALSGWLFRFFIIATWVLPFAAPLLIGTFANSFALQGVCPACKRQFMGYRNQVIRCSGCGNIVWQPGAADFSKKRSNSSNRPSESDIIDIEIKEK